MPKTRGIAWAIIALGTFGLVIPFVGPLFNFGMGPAPAFEVNAFRVTRHVLPGAVIIIGGLLMLSGSEGTRRAGMVASILGGAWLGVGPWAFDVGGIGQFIRRGVYHWANGLLILGLAAYALGRVAVTTLDLRTRMTTEERTEVGV